jgi:hypothetical protein
MKLVITALLAAVAVDTAALAQYRPYKCQRYDWNCQAPPPPVQPPQPLAPQAGYGPGRPHKCLRYDWTCGGGPVQPLPPLSSDFAPHGVAGRQRLENSPYAPTEPPPAMKQWR